MNTLFIGKNLLTLESVDSTNTFASALLGGRPAEGTVVRALHQTAGRGQQGSQWHAEPGANLTFSLILYPTFLDLRRIFLLNKMIAVALRDTVAALLPADRLVQVKWPNDILVDRRKVAGILIETGVHSDRLRSVIVGIGLNVNQSGFDPSLHGQATSLAVALGRPLVPEDVLAVLLAQVEAGYMALRAGRFEGIERSYLQHLYAYQEDTRIEVGGVERLLHVVGVDADGRIALQDGQKLYFYGVKEIKFIL